MFLQSFLNWFEPKKRLREKNQENYCYKIIILHSNNIVRSKIQQNQANFLTQRIPILSLCCMDRVLNFNDKKHFLQTSVDKLL